MEWLLNYFSDYKKWVIFVSFSIFTTSLFSKDMQPDITFEKGEIEIGSRKIKVEFARTDQQKQKGLMYRDTLLADTGMLFFFDSDLPLSFWMKNTYIDLSIAYISKEKKIVDIQDMKATSALLVGAPPSYPSKKPAMYALEVNKGWFKKNKIKVGDRLKIVKN